MLSGNISGSKLRELEYEIGYKKHFISLKLEKTDLNSVEYLYDAELTEATNNQLEYLKQCDAVCDKTDYFIPMFYGALSVLCDCLDSGDEERFLSAIVAYKKINLNIDSAIGSIQIGDFVADSVILDYIKKISGLKATVLLSEITV
ncbi:MAG: hypothetical protein KAJ20_02835 [Candidatus Aenigmarchaeota archaeon]|nr:hypothetical protein [Candidatus Aenigmarchaeota archaeon]